MNHDVMPAQAGIQIQISAVFGRGESRAGFQHSLE
jgi:hypothetical protein